MRVFSAIVLASSLISAQTRPDKSSRVALGAIDFSGAVMTKPFRIAAAPSGSCSNAAEVLLAGADIWGCVSGSWTKIGGGGLPVNTTGVGNSESELASMAATQNAIDAKTVAVIAGTDNGKTAVVDETGVPILKNVSRLDSFIFDSGQSGVAISASCTADMLVALSAVKRFNLLSINRSSPTDIAGGSATVTIYTSPALGSIWTSIGTASIGSGVSRAEVTLTATIAANSWVMACVTGTPTVIEKLIVAPMVN